MELGLHIIRNNGTLHCASVILRHFDFMIVGCRDIYATIDSIKKLKHKGKVIVQLSKKETYIFGENSKDMKMAFALLYDFADAFLISGFNELDEDVDPLINQRLYNDEYKPIFLKVESDSLYDDMDEILSYSLLSNIDGLSVSNPRLLKYAIDEAKGNLSFIADIDGPEHIMDVKECMADISMLSIKSSDCPLFSCSTRGKVRRALEKTGFANN